MVVNKNFSGAIHCRFGMHPEDRNVQLMHVADLIFLYAIICITPLPTSQRSLSFVISDCLYWDNHAAELSINAYGTERQTCTLACQAQCCNLVCGGIISLSNKKKTSLTNKNKEIFFFLSI